MTNDTITDRAELIRRIDELTKTVEALQAQLAPNEKAEVTTRASVTGSRRDIRRLAGTAAAGAVAGSELASAQPAAAATGDTMFVGHANGTTNMTYLTYTTLPGHNVSNPLTTEATLMWVDNRLSPNTNGVGPAPAP
jgi:hypothetical protein